MSEHQNETTLTLVRSELIYEWFGLRLVRDEVEGLDGERFEYTYVDHPGSVIVVPRLVSGEYVLVEQYRYPIRQRSLEFPAGAYDTAERAAETARRELLEETSLHAGELHELGRIAPSNGFCSEWMIVFLADGLTGTPDPHTITTARERHTVTAVGELRMIDYIRDGRITDGATLAALTLLFVAKGQR